MPTVLSEPALRKRATKLGLRLVKSRARKTHLHNCGHYMLVDDRNVVVAGERYQLTLNEVHGFLVGTAMFRGVEVTP